MDTHQIFRKHILPTLLTIAKRSHSLGSIVSISLYGSANYGPYDKDTSRKGFDSEKSDYDIWVVFKRDHLSNARIFATELFGVNFNLVPNQQACILYEKMRLRTKVGSLLIAPIIVTENCYEIFQEKVSRLNEDTLIHWYRPRARERPPRVPICSPDLTWSEFDMLQTYLPDIRLWKLMMPAIAYHDGIVTLGTFLECVLSGDHFYGSKLRVDSLKRNLLIEALKQFHLEELVGVENIPAQLYQMMTVATKAGPKFKKRKLHQFTQWLSK